MNGALKRIRSCPAHRGRGTRYRPQPLTHPNTFRNKSLLAPRKPHTPIFPQKLPRNPDILDHTPPTLVVPYHEIDVEPTTTPASRHSDPTLHQRYLTPYRH